MGVVDEGGWTVNDLVRVYLLRHDVPPSGRGRVLGRLARCRTAALGGHVLACGDCGHEETVYNSCLDRHCPTCLGKEARAWVEKQQESLLPTPYFHVVFTVPRPVAELALYNKTAVYGLLMRVSAEVVKTIAADKKYLGGEVGFLSVLHTWSQTLEHHPHVHMVVPGGALCETGTRWQRSRRDFFLPTRVLGALFRRRFLEELERLRAQGKLQYRGAARGLRETTTWSAMVAQLRREVWVVYAKRPFGGPEQVLEYLARYTHRVAIGNRRIVAFDGQHVTFRYRASLEPYTEATRTLSLDAFIERFCLHVLPKGFTRIRSYGFLAGHQRARKLSTIRRLIGFASCPARVPPPEDTHVGCPNCGKGQRHEARELRALEPIWGPRSKLQFATAGPPQEPTPAPRTVLQDAA